MKTARRLFFYLIGAVALIAAIGAGLVYFVPAVQDRLIGMIADRALSRDRTALLAEDGLRVAICGSGSPMPDFNRAPACNLVFAGGEVFVIDVGAGSWQRAGSWQMPAGQGDDPASVAVLSTASCR